MRSWLQSYWGQRAAWLAPLLPLVWMTDLTGLLWIGLTVVFLLLLPEARKATFAMVYRSVPVSLLIGVVVGCVLAFVIDPWLVTFAEELTGTRMDLSQLAELPGNDGALIEWLILGLGFGAIWEEIAFRGYFIGWGAVLFGTKWAVPLAVLVAIVFGYGHIWQDLAGAIVSGVGGLVFGLTYVFCQRKLLPAMTVHAVTNIVGIMDIYLYGL